MKTKNPTATGKPTPKNVTSGELAEILIKLITDKGIPSQTWMPAMGMCLLNVGSNGVKVDPKIIIKMIESIAELRDSK